MKSIPGRKLYLRKSVYEALLERADWIFQEFENIVISVSSGKDSTVLFDVFTKEARRRQRKINVFFLDQEAEYQATVDLMRFMMYEHTDVVIPGWYQAPIRMTNATSYEDDFLNAWWPGEEWMREREPIAVTEAPGAPTRFYPFFEWHEQQWSAKQQETCFLVGLRSEESLNRFRAVIKNPALPGVNWSSKGKGGTPKLYPIYDWSFEDVWTYIGKNKVRYNPIYDWLWVKGASIGEMRVSNLIHEKAFKCLVSLQEFEPETFDKMCKRLKGVHTAALYAKEQSVYSARKRPARFGTWKDYREFLLETYPSETRDIFIDRFAGQADDESVYRQQCRQLLINDWENNIPVVKQETKEDSMKKWMDLL